MGENEGAGSGWRSRRGAEQGCVSDRCQLDGRARRRTMHLYSCWRTHPRRGSIAAALMAAMMNSAPQLTPPQLAPATYDRARGLFRALSHHLATTAILDGSAPATLYVDDPDQPRAAFARTGYRCFLAGSPRQPAFNAQMHMLFAETLCPQALASGQEWFELKTASAAWETPLRTTILPDQEIIAAARQYFRFTALRHDWRKLLPAGFRLEEITPALLAQTHLAHLDELREELCSERPTVADFLQQSFGLAAICDADQALAGWCTSEYNSGAACEVGIGTLEPYQRRGIATALGSAFVELALRRGVTTIGWHCWARNVASAATARAIGFTHICDYTTFVARWRDLRRPAAAGAPARG